MAEQHPRSNTTDYSSSQAPETQEAGQKPHEHDYRAIPGGDPARATAALGMESLDRDASVSTGFGQTRVDDTRDRDAPPSRRGQ